MAARRLDERPAGEQVDVLYGHGHPECREEAQSQKEEERMQCRQQQVRRVKTALVHAGVLLVPPGQALAALLRRGGLEALGADEPQRAGVDEEVLRRVARRGRGRRLAPALPVLARPQVPGAQQEAEDHLLGTDRLQPAHARQAASLLDAQPVADPGALADICHGQGGAQMGGLVLVPWGPLHSHGADLDQWASRAAGTPARRWPPTHVVEAGPQAGH
mmetsp:Transcript_36385/g.113367  ORF Transcript_36385/g.113367 Transcript_36385/m.113367 type:complete len:218 (-) Transcript_36385:279-932(-)